MGTWMVEKKTKETLRRSMMPIQAEEKLAD